MIRRLSWMLGTLICLLVVALLIQRTNTVHGAIDNNQAVPDRFRGHLLPNMMAPDLDDVVIDEVTIEPEAADRFTRLVFQSYTNSNWEIFSTTIAHPFILSQVTHNNGHDIQPDYPRDIDKIVYASVRGDNYEIVRMGQGGGNQVQLTDVEGNDTRPRWSPDATRIVFESERAGGTHIYVMDEFGGDLQRLTFSGDFNGMASWSPDGHKILFTSDRNGPAQIWTMNADGTEQRLLSTQPNSYFPVWSPDGARIAYAVPSSDGWLDLWVMKSDGSSAYKLYNQVGSKDLWPRGWTADSTAVNFSRLTFVQQGSIWYWVKSRMFSYKLTGGDLEEYLIDDSLVFNVHPDAEQFDYTPAETHLGRLPQYLRGSGFWLFWLGQDDISGVFEYTLYKRTSTQHSWDVVETVPRSTLWYWQSFDAGQNAHYYVSALDNAFNEEPFDLENSTFSTQFAGYLMLSAMDNRGIPAHGVGVSHALDLLRWEESAAEFNALFKTEGNVQFELSHDAFGPMLPITYSTIATNGALTVVLPPADNLIQNHSFETEDAAWALTGDTAPTFEPYGHVGHAALGLNVPAGSPFGTDLCIRPPGSAPVLGCDFTEISAAVEAVEPGQTIWVMPGEYRFQSAEIPSNVSIRSVAGSLSTFIHGSKWEITDAEHVLIEGLTFRYHDEAALYIVNASNIIVRDNRFVRMGDDESVLSIEFSSVEIIGNSFERNRDDFSETGASCMSLTSSDAFVYNNAFMFEYGHCIRLIQSSTQLIEIHNNLFAYGNVGIIGNGSASVRNNAFVGVDAVLEGCPAESIAYNLFWDFEESLPADCGTQMNNLITNPRLDGLDQRVFVPRFDSPLYDAGDPNSAANDIDGSRNDIGLTGGPYAGPLSVEPVVAWEHLWMDLTTMSGEAVTVTMGIDDGTSAYLSAASQTAIIPADMPFPTLSMMVQTYGLTTTTGADTFVVTVEASNGMTATQTISVNGQDIGVLIDEVTLGSSGTDLGVIAPDVAYAAPGSLFTYPFAVENLSGIDAEGVVVSYTLPAGVTYQSASITPTSIISDTLVWQLGSLAAHSSILIDVILGLSDSTPAMTVVVGELATSSLTHEINLANNLFEVQIYAGHLVNLPAIPGSE